MTAASTSMWARAGVMGPPPGPKGSNGDRVAAVGIWSWAKATAESQTGLLGDGHRAPVGPRVSVPLLVAPSRGGLRPMGRGGPAICDRQGPQTVRGPRGPPPVGVQRRFRRVSVGCRPCRRLCLCRLLCLQGCGHLWAASRAGAVGGWRASSGRRSGSAPPHKSGGGIPGRAGAAAGLCGKLRRERGPPTPLLSGGGGVGGKPLKK